MTKQDKILRIAEIEQELLTLPKGKVFYKKIKGKEQPYLTDSLTGILKADIDIKHAREERLREKYAVID